MSASTLSLFPSNSIHFGWILVLIRCSLFRFRFLDEFMYVYVCVHSFASCNRFLLSLFYFLSFRCMFSPLVRGFYFLFFFELCAYLTRPPFFHPFLPSIVVNFFLPCDDYLLYFLFIKVTHCRMNRPQGQALMMVQPRLRCRVL